MKDIIEIENKTISYSKFLMSKNGLEAVGEPTYQEWLKLGEFLRNANGSVHFWIGDWLNYGEKKYGETYAQAIDETGYDYQTLATAKWVAKRVERSRRRENLSFSHHQEIADLEPEDQDQMLSLAEKDHMNRNDFRKVVRKYKLSLDLPELNPDELTSDPAEFKKTQELVIMLIEATDEVKAIQWDALNPDAKDYLLAQIRKTAGVLGGVIHGNESRQKLVRANVAEEEPSKDPSA